MREDGGEPDEPHFIVNGRRLHRRDFMSAEAFAHDFEAAGQWGIAKGPILLTRERRADGGGQRFLRVGELALCLGQRRRDRANGFTGPVHRLPPRCLGDQNWLPLIWTVWRGCHGRRLPWR